MERSGWRNRTTNSLRAVKIVFRREFEDERPYQREFEGLLKFEPISRSHPSQLAILHVGRNDQAGCFYYVMELADDAASPVRSSSRGNETHLSSGSDKDQSLVTSTATYIPRTLRHEIRQHGRLPVTQCVELGGALATALAHLHSQGLVHRDVK